jgi:hypothetical protein
MLVPELEDLVGNVSQGNEEALGGEGRRWWDRRVVEYGCGTGALDRRGWAQVGTRGWVRKTIRFWQKRLSVDFLSTS